MKLTDMPHRSEKFLAEHFRGRAVTALIPEDWRKIGSQVTDTANQAFDVATRIIDVFKEDRERITIESDRDGSVLRIHGLFSKFRS